MKKKRMQQIIILSFQNVVNYRIKLMPIFGLGKSYAKRKTSGHLNILIRSYSWKIRQDAIGMKKPSHSPSLSTTTNFAKRRLQSSNCGKRSREPAFGYSPYQLRLLSVYYIERTRRRKIRNQYEHLQRLIATSQQHIELRKELSIANVADLKNSKTYKTIYQKCENSEALTKEDWKEIESLFNAVMPYFLPNLRSIYSFNETEWKLSLLVKMDFSWHEIATLVSLTYPAIYSSQTRLHKKVFKNDVTYQSWKDFINSL